MLAQVGLAEMPDTLVTDLGVGKQQLVEIAKALVQAGAAVDPRRADRQPERERQRGIAGSPAGIPRPGHRLDPDLAQIVGGRPRRRPDHGAARRPHRRQHRLPGRAGGRGPDHPQHGRSRPCPSLSATHRHDRRTGVRGAGLDGASSAAPGSPGDQGRQFRGPARRGGRDRRADGRRPHRIRHEPVRPRLGRERSAAASGSMAGKSTCPASPRRSMPASLTSPRTASNSA